MEESCMYLETTRLILRNLKPSDEAEYLLQLQA